MVLVERLLGQREQQVEVLGLGIIDLAIGDDDLRLRRAAARLGAVGLALSRVLVVVDGGRLGEDLAGEHEALAALAGEAQFVTVCHRFPPGRAPASCALQWARTRSTSFRYSSVYSGRSSSTNVPVTIASSFSSSSSCVYLDWLTE